MAGYVFISYSRTDRPYVEALAAHLTQAGIAVWYDYEIASGDRFAEVIREQIEGCSAFLVVLSPDAVASKWVDRELGYADALGTPARPLLLHACRLPFLLTGVHYDDVQGGRMPSDRFVAELRTRASVPGTARATAASPANPVDHTDTVWSVAWSPDSRRVASVSSDKTTILWDAATGAAGRIITGRRQLASVAWSPDGQSLATGNVRGEILVLDPVTAVERATMTGHSSTVWAVDWSPDGHRLASAGFDRTVQLWDTRTWTHLETLAVPEATLWSVAWSPNGRLVAAGGRDGTVRMWSTVDMATRPDITASAWARAVAWAPNGRHLAVAGEPAVIWDVPNGKPLHHLGSGHTLAVAWSPDGARLATGTSDGQLTLWSTDTGATVRELPGHEGEIQSVAWSPNGQRLATGGQDHTVRLWTV